MRDELFCVSHIQKIAEDFAKKMVEMNLQVDEVIFTEYAGGTYHVQNGVFVKNE